ncbi:hypothetical protein HNY73_006636 [Argiope bruennichi]|uniref:Uncharacterized protein n=1 Tax=Argiope bruennichi TaxID=94029 RepID=A0A8T0FGM4_ARGBR|nr:hypothetical protein HNY73_006636 [Argiope bruennichi]
MYFNSWFFKAVRESRIHRILSSSPGTFERQIPIRRGDHQKPVGNFFSSSKPTSSFSSTLLWGKAQYVF